MKKFESVRTAGVFAEVIQEEGTAVKIRYSADGKEQDITAATLKRWWKPVEEGSEDVKEEIKETTGEVVGDEQTEVKTEDTKVEDTEAKNEDPADKSAEDTNKPADSEKPPKAPKEHKHVEAHPLKAYFIEQAAQRDCTVFSGKVEALVQVKHEGMTCIAFTFSGKGINIWMKSKSVVGVVKDFKTTNHLFDARLSLTEDDAKSKKIIVDVLEASIGYQAKAKTNKDAEKAAKEAKKAADKAAEKAAAKEQADKEKADKEAATA